MRSLPIIELRNECGVAVADKGMDPRDTNDAQNAVICIILRKPAFGEG